jgi:glycosyltransferase involved in cell wall biosynthesis
VDKRPLKIGFIHNAFPVLSQTFISKEMLGLQELGISLKIYSLFRPAEGQQDTTYSRPDDVDYVLPALKLWRLLTAHVYFLFKEPSRYLETLSFALNHRQSSSRFLGLLLAFAQKKTNKEQRQDMLLHFILAAPLAKKMQRDNITFVNSHFADAAASFALLTARLLDLEYGVTTHAYDIFTPQYNFAEKLANARFVLTCTNYNNRALLEQQSELSEEKVNVFYHGIDTGKFERSAPAKDDIVEIIAVGRLVRKKGFNILLRACATLRDRGFRFKCRIIGDGPLSAELSQLIDELRLHDEVDLVGALPGMAIRDYYERAHIFALPCVIEKDGNRDGIPNVIAEAMAMHLPVVSSRISGIPELVKDGVTGFLAEQRDTQAIADALEQLIRNPSLRQQMGESGRERVKKIFDSDVCLQNLHDFYIKELSNSDLAP